MQPYDLAMLAILAYTTFSGARRGMTWQIASLVSMGLSYTAAMRFSTQLATQFGEQAPWNRFAAMLALYLGTSTVVWIAFHWVSGLIERVRLQGFDRQLGALFGATKGSAVCLLITFFAVTLSTQARGMVLASHSGRYMATLIQQADPLLPDELHEVLDPYLDPLQQRLRATEGEPFTVTRGSAGRRAADQGR